MANPRFYDFYEYRIDALKRLLLRDGQRVKEITSKPFGVLLMLVENRGQVVNTDDFLNVVWPGLQVAEASLTGCIYTLRRAFREDPGENRFIATIPNVGYQFVAPVTELESIDDSQQGKSRVTADTPSPDPDIYRLRSEGGPVSLDEAKVMVIRHDFYDKAWNEAGRGIKHRYRRLILKGAIVVLDDATGLMWQRDSSSSRFQWGPDADKCIADLNAKKFADFDDWRLPALEELMSLVTPAQIGIPITLMSATESWSPGEDSRWDEVERKALVHLDPVFEKGDAHWASNEASPLEVVGNLSERGWAVGFIDGCCFPELTDRNFNIKAVRSI